MQVIKELMEFLEMYAGKDLSNDEATFERGKKLKNKFVSIIDDCLKDTIIKKDGAVNLIVNWPDHKKIVNEIWYEGKLDGYKRVPIGLSVFLGKDAISVAIELNEKKAKGSLRNYLNQYRNRVNEIISKNKGLNSINVGEGEDERQRINIKIDKNDAWDDDYYKEEIKKGIISLIDICKEMVMWDSDLKAEIDKAFREKRQIILTGAPGTGKTHTAREFACEVVGSEDSERIGFVQFHPSFDYSDFIEGLRPVRLDTSSNNYTFVRVDGVFKRFCRNILDKEITEPCFFIIDEINRADLSKVFGELMYGLDESYRNKKPFPQSQYSYLPTYKITDGIGEILDGKTGKKDVYKEGFFIPENLYIIGTMNDIDRSVEAFDYALRRRFKWIEVKANDVMRQVLESIKNKKIAEGNTDWDDLDVVSVSEKAKKMNSVISGEEWGRRFDLNEAYHVGPAYFEKITTKDKDGKKVPDYKTVFEEYIKPILIEYTRGQPDKDREVFYDACEDALCKED